MNRDNVKDININDAISIRNIRNNINNTIGSRNSINNINTNNTRNIINTSSISNTVNTTNSIRNCIKNNTIINIICNIINDTKHSIINNTINNTKNIINILILFILISIINIRNVSAVCSGRIFNPLTDVCWSCMLPISIGSVETKASTLPDTINPPLVPCVCPGKILGLPQVGLPVGFWEGMKIFDVTKDPFCFVSLGGEKIPAQVFTGRGSNSITKGGALTNWHIHLYSMPIFLLFDSLMDILCLDFTGYVSDLFSLTYLSELDILWLDDELNFIFYPESVIFANPIAQAACVADCVAATSYLSLDPLFWCAGCQGSMYPMTGNVVESYGSIQASTLAVDRFTFKLGRQLQEWNVSGIEAQCQAIPMPILMKSKYRTQLTYPVPMSLEGLMGCQPMGRSNVIYDSGKEIPIKGEDFAYLLWRKRNCCVL
jgi:conjugal transfer pilus assembly protein TraU